MKWNWIVIQEPATYGSPFKAATHDKILAACPFSYTRFVVYHDFLSCGVACLC